MAMLSNFQVPPRAPRPASAERATVPPVRVPYLAALWTPAGLAALAATLARGGEDLRTLPDEALLDAWAATVEGFLDPESPERQELAPPLAALCELSPAGLDAGLEAVLGGVRRRPAAALLARAAPLRRVAEAADGAGMALRRAARKTADAGAPSAVRRRAAEEAPGAEVGPRAGAVEAPVQAATGTSPVLVVLASNLPALAVQPLLAVLALRRPVLLKSPSAEPLFAPAFLSALVRREPRLAGAVAAATWPGGDAELEAPVLAAAGTVVAYGGSEALADLARRTTAARFVGYGPKISLAAVELDGGDTDLEAMAVALARDVALFDQRGCLSVQAVYVAGGLEAAALLAGRLEAALGSLAARWPPGPALAAALAAVQQARLEAELRGQPPAALPAAAGTVLLDPEPSLRASPGLRTVRVHPLPDLERLPEILAPWHGRLQGAALAGAAAWRLAPRLAELGISRLAEPGDLQSPDAAWHNGGIDPLSSLILQDAEPDR